MEDPRLSRMYARLFSANVGRARRRAGTWFARNRSALGRALLVFAVLGLGAGYYAHLQGRFRRLKVELQARNEPAAAAPLPGGQEPVVLTRAVRGDSSFPEFLSMTLLPGRGMSVLQITALIPGRGEIALLAGPTLQEATELLTGAGADRQGAKTLALGGPIEVPWAGVLHGTTEEGDTVQADWHGHPLVLPRTGSDDGTPVSEGGLMLKSPADSVSHDVMPDGGNVQGNFSSASFSSRWPSQLSVTTSVLLSGRAIEMRIVARNDGTEATPAAIGWFPRFVVLGGDRRSVLLRLPAQQSIEEQGGRVTGRLSNVADTPFDFMGRSGRLLGEQDLDKTFVSLKSGFLESGPTVELRDPQSGIGLRLTALSPQIRAVRVRAHAKDNVVALGFQTNYTDPLSRQWPSTENTGMVGLQPGQSVVWRARLELMALSQSDMPPL